MTAAQLKERVAALEVKCTLLAASLKQADHQIADLVAALKGVVRVADRQTDEFDAARAAIAKATGSAA